MRVVGVHHLVFKYLEGSTIVRGYAPVHMSIVLLYLVHTGLAEMTST